MSEQLSNVGLALLSGVVCGFLIGLVYFRHLWRSIESFGVGGAGLRLAFGTLLRISIAVAVFVSLMQWSAVAALSGLIGFSLARNRIVAKAGLT